MPDRGNVSLHVHARSGWSVQSIKRLTQYLLPSNTCSTGWAGLLIETSLTSGGRLLEAILRSDEPTYGVKCGKTSIIEESTVVAYCQGQYLCCELVHTCGMLCSCPGHTKTNCVHVFYFWL